MTDSMDDLLATLRRGPAADREKAAERLGKQGDPDAAPALIETLATVELPREHLLAVEVMGALAALRGPGTAAAVVAFLRRVPLVLDRLCDDLADVITALGDPTVVPELEALFADRACPSRDAVARALTSLGGAREGGFFLRFVKSRNVDVRAPAVRAVGRLRCAEARPALRRALRSEDDDVRMPALAALLAMGDEEALRALDAPALLNANPITLLENLRGGTPAEVADALVRLAERPEWATLRRQLELRLEALATAAALGHVQARALLRQAAEDGGLAPCTSATAAALLLEPGDEARVAPLCAFLRVPRTGRETTPTEEFERAAFAEDKAVRALADHAARHPASLLPIVDLLNDIRRERLGHDDRTISSAAGAVRWLSGTVRYSEYDAWRAAREPRP